MKKMTIKEIAGACGGKFFGDDKLLGFSVDDIGTDTRKMKPGCLFIPIKGENFDGHDYIDEAFKEGASVTLSENDVAGRPYIKVKSTFQALKDIAEYYRSLFDIKVIAVTGSVGKTTTKEMIYSVLAQKYNVLKSEKNYNNEIGVPLTLFNLTDGHETAVIEMGMNHFGEISRLSKAARPDVCVITNIGHSHIEFLGSREGILKAKAEIFDYMNAGGTAVLNGDDDMLQKTKEHGFKTVFYGFGKGCEVNIAGFENLDFESSKADIYYKGGLTELKIPAPGRHMAYAAGAAYAVGKMFGIDDESIERGIKSFEPVGMRMEVIETGRITVLNDAYNASPESVKAAAEVLITAYGRKVCVLGDMFELGGKAPELHRSVGEYIAACGADVLLCAGGLSKHTAEGASEAGIYAKWFETRDEMVEKLNDYIKEGDTVLVKASRGMHFEDVVEALKDI